MFKLLLWAADYYRHPIGEVLAAAIPSQLRDGAPLRDDEVVWRLTAAGRANGLAELPARAARLRAAVEFLVREEAATGEAIGAGSQRSAQAGEREDSSNSSSEPLLPRRPRLRSHARGRY